MQVLLWGALYHPHLGGEERYIARLATGLLAQGAQVEVVTNTLPGSPTTEVVDGVAVTRLPFPRSRQGDLAALREVRSGLRMVFERLRPDVVNLHTSGPSLAHLALHRSVVNVPLVVTFHGVYPSTRAVQSAVAAAVGGCAVAIATSSATRTSLDALCGSRLLPIDVHHPAVGSVNVGPVPLPRSGIVLGVGRHVPEKGWEHLLRAFEMVRLRAPAATLRLVGDGPDRQRLEALAAASLPSGVATFTGEIDDRELIVEMDAADVVVMPSVHEEGFGMVAIEAAARGRPVVASARGGLHEAVIDGVTGLLVAPADPRELATAIVTVLSDHRRADEFGSAGIRHSERFSAGKLARSTLASFERALLR
ncbi:MAG TPA: glycosyltransferase family 4 protein [Ilumatobacteraceae bacterium]|nr:glycosyltransferase family 4 protein [Ilumatobacteraceae bacterium]